MADGRHCVCTLVPNCVQEQRHKVERKRRQRQIDAWQDWHENWRRVGLDRFVRGCQRGEQQPQRLAKREKLRQNASNAQQQRGQNPTVPVVAVRDYLCISRQFVRAPAPHAVHLMTCGALMFVMKITRIRNRFLRL